MARTSDFAASMHRRHFLAELGTGMLVAGVGVTTAANLGFAPIAAAEQGGGDVRLHFGSRERLVELIQNTSAEKLLPELAARLRAGLSLKELVGATALANARRFGGEDYVGFHTFMALSPALWMAQQLTGPRQPLPIFKVLFRNASQIEKTGGPAKESLRRIDPLPAVSATRAAQRIREAIHQHDLTTAERTLASEASPAAAWNDVLETVLEATDVHRVVLAHRAWDILELVGVEQAQTMLRQSLRYCASTETARVKYQPGLAGLLEKVFDQHHLAGRTVGERAAEEAWLDRFCETLLTVTPEQAAYAVGAALAEGFAPQAIADAVSLAANQLLLRDGGRLPQEARPGKPAGSVHGDSVGLHACDSANAWRHISQSSHARNSMASAIVSAYHVANDRVRSGRKFGSLVPRPLAEVLAKVPEASPEKTLQQLEGAIRGNQQELACALAERYCVAGHSPRKIFDLLLQYAISEDGALHAEKFYRTATDEYARLRPAFRHRQVVALARVSASQFGFPAPGVDEARRLLQHSG